MSVTAQINAHRNSLTPAERAFADYVLENNDIIYKSITLVTEDSKAGYGTIIRFCQKLGYSGFQDFKIHLAQERGRTGASDKARDDTLPLVEQAIAQLRITASGLNQETMRRVATRLTESARVLTIGVAGSFPTALELTYRLCRMGVHSTAEQDGHMQIIRAEELGADSALVAVSHSGATRDILDTVRIAKERGVYVAAITNYLRSPLTEIAEDALCASIWEEALQSEIGTRLPFFLVIEALCGLIYKNSEVAEGALSRTSDSVASKQI